MRPKPRPWRTPMVKSRKCFEPYIYYVRYDRPTLRVGTEEFPDKVLTILCDRKDGLIIWENQGTFKLIPAGVLLNLSQARLASQKLAKSYPLVKGPRSLSEITWDQGVPITPTVVEHLLLTPCDATDESTEPDTPAETNGEDQPDQPELETG